MVYATGNNRTFVSKKNLKTTRVQSETSRDISNYMRSHRISIQTDPSGKVIVKTEKAQQ